ncbi:MAG TPA: radical SAM protein [Candidatus Bathyarchaeia archaeon]|nr:radical SAM protein [Candidatus Bathyarchaeia archaeon]
MTYRFITQVSESKNLGKVMHINFYSNKTCTYNCVYCGDGPTDHQTLDRKFLFGARVVIDEIEDYILKEGKPDYIWFTCKGEPTLNLMFGKIVNEIRKSYPEIKIGTWTNGTLLNREDVCKELALCDHIIVDLDSVNNDEFQKINRPIISIKLESLLENIKSFRKNYPGKFWIHTVFLRGYNDSDKNLLGLRKYFEELNPDQLYISYGLKSSEGPLTDEFKENFKQRFNDGKFEIKIE